MGKVNNEKAEAYNCNGNANFVKGEYDKAIADYTKAIELEILYTEAYNNRADAYSAKGEYGKAMEDYNQSIELEPYGNYLRDNSYRDLAKSMFEIEIYTKELELNPEYSEVLNCRGIAYFSVGEYDKAIADYTKAIKLSSEYASAYDNRGNSYYKKGEYDKAMEDYKKVLELDSEYAKEYYDSYCESYYFRTFHMIRKRIYQRLIPKITQRPFWDEGIYEYDEFGFREREAEWSYYFDDREAIVGITKAIERNPKNKEAYICRADIHYKYETYDKALEDYISVTRLGVKNSRIYYNIGDAYCHLENYEKAITNYSKIVELTPEDVKVYHKRGEAYEKLHIIRKAKADYVKAIELEPEDATAYYKLAVLYSLLKGANLDKALSYVNGAIELDVNNQAYLDMKKVICEKMTKAKIKY